MKSKHIVLLVTIAITNNFAAANSPTIGVLREESSITYHLVHPLHKIEATSKDVNFRLDADVATKEIRRVAAQVDVTTFNSGNSNRDSHAMEVIDAMSYPDVRFTSTSVGQTGDSLTITGKLTFHGVTRDVVMKAISAWSQNRLVVRGGFNVSLSAFNIERPSLLMIPVEDELSFSFAETFKWE